MDSIRLVTLNLWGEQPPLAERMALTISGLRALHPDVVALQEVRQIEDVLPNQAETLARALGLTSVFATATPWGGGDEGLAILSRYPITSHSFRELPHATQKERRIVLGAILDTPAGSFSAFTTHLNYRLADGQIREDQLVAVDEFVKAHDSSLPKVLMGDFNAVPESDEIRWLRGLRSIAGLRVFYQDAFARIHPGEAGYTWATRNSQTSRLSFLETDRRLDYIFVTPLGRDGRGQVLDSRIVLDEPNEEGVFSSDHFGLYAEVRLTAVLE
jgi:endonuclease/exonuclease/phosphatase family metal-dependent hydrolase